MFLVNLKTRYIMNLRSRFNMVLSKDLGAEGGISLEK